VVTPSGAPGRTFEPISRTYNNVTTNIPNADFVAYDTSGGPGGNPREIRVVNTAAAGQPVSVPVEIVSQGNERSIGFSIAYDPALLGVPTGATCGGGFAGCTITQFDTSVAGRVGITVSRGTAPAAGVRELVIVTSPTFPNAAPSTPLVFADVPVARATRDADGNLLPTLYSNGFATFALGASLGFEGDIVGANGGPAGGDGVRANDVTVIRRFVLGLAAPDVPSGQFRRADVSPVASGGDGAVDASDVTVVRLYAIGALPPTLAAGPGGPTSTRPDDEGEGLELNRPTAVGRIVKAVNTLGISGQQVIVQFQLDSQGDEASLSFTVNFDPTKLAYVSAAAGTQVPAGTVPNLNTSQVAQGRLGVLLDSTNTYAQGDAADPHRDLRGGGRLDVAVDPHHVLIFPDGPDDVQRAGGAARYNVRIGKRDFRSFRVRSERGRTGDESERAGITQCGGHDDGRCRQTTHREYGIVRHLHVRGCGGGKELRSGCIVEAFPIHFAGTQRDRLSGERRFCCDGIEAGLKTSR
jgi:hypothetical protein